MALLQSFANSSPISHYSHQPNSPPGLTFGGVHPSVRSSFNGLSLCLLRSSLPRQTRARRTPRLSIMMIKPAIQFIQGTDEQTIPDVRLTKSRDGTNGMAIFRFDQPSVFDSSSEVGDITGFYMIDEEGVLQSVDVSAKFVNGKPAGIEAKYVIANSTRLGSVHEIYGTLREPEWLIFRQEMRQFHIFLVLHFWSMVLSFVMQLMLL